MKIITLKKDDNFNAYFGVVDEITASQITLKLSMQKIQFGSDYAIKQREKDDKYTILLFPKAIKALEKDFTFQYIK